MDEKTLTNIEGADVKTASSPKLDMHHRLGCLYNTMLYPVKNFTARGFLWYQGESNIFNYQLYAPMMTAMVQLWRDAWESPDMPFYYVQIAPWNGYSAQNGACLREQQAGMLTRMTNVGMVTIGDLVNDISDIHPSLKKEVGFRLGNMALYEKYNQKEVNPFSPMLKSFQIKKNRVLVTTTASGKLVCKGKTIQHFEVIDETGKCYPAQAKLLHDGEYKQIPAYRVEAVDTTAAGDTFCGALCVALSEDMDVFNAVKFANKCASITVTRMGAQSSLPYRKEIDYL